MEKLSKVLGRSLLLLSILVGGMSSYSYATEKAVEKDTGEESEITPRKDTNTLNVAEEIKTANQLFRQQKYIEAAIWLKEAADLGSTVAQYNLGYMYDRGYGIGRDHYKAATWYKRQLNRDKRMLNII